ncbi:hypothetical protein LIER_43724 [Lithospermum erythrorhizon]|uniref:Reverse transcriptase domain-containing protein n=1 Tax=Lithospermum erythrorhizon TaxID=34254 RepID=A0AAV3QNK7_LITER
MFANDTLLMGKATIEEAAKFKQILTTYEIWSAQLISAQKSTILFSPNVDRATRKYISDMLGMLKVQFHMVDWASGIYKVLIKSCSANKPRS